MSGSVIKKIKGVCMERDQDSQYMVSYYFGSVEGIRVNWKWFLGFGIALVLIGALAMSAAVFTTLLTIVLIGSLLLVAGIVQSISSIWAHKWSGGFQSLLAGILYSVLGIVILLHPSVTALTITLLLIILYIIGGLVKIAAALTTPFQQRGLILFSGIISVVLGGLIWAQWPVSGLWVIGLFIGIDLVIVGLTWISLALTARNYQNS